MRFKSNDPPIGYGGLFYKPRYTQRFITGGMLPVQTQTQTPTQTPIQAQLPAQQPVHQRVPRNRNDNIIILNPDPVLAPVPVPAPAPTIAPALSKAELQDLSELMTSSLRKDLKKGQNSLHTHVFQLKKYLKEGIENGNIKDVVDINKWINEFKRIKGTKGIQKGISGIVTVPGLKGKPAKYTAPFIKPPPKRDISWAGELTQPLHKLRIISINPYNHIVRRHYRLTDKYEYIYDGGIINTGKSIKDKFYADVPGIERGGLIFEYHTLTNMKFIRSLLSRVGTPTTLSDIQLENNVFNVGELLTLVYHKYIVYDGVILGNNPYLLEMKKYNELKTVKFRSLKNGISDSQELFNDWFIHTYTQEIINDNEDLEYLSYVIKNNPEELMNHYFRTTDYSGIVVKFTKFQLYKLDVDILEYGIDGINDERGYKFLMEKANKKTSIQQASQWNKDGKVTKLYMTSEEDTAVDQNDEIDEKLFPHNEEYDVLIIVGFSDSIVVCNVSELIRDKVIDRHIFNSCRLAYSAYSGEKTDDHYKIPIEWFKTIDLSKC